MRDIAARPLPLPGMGLSRRVTVRRRLSLRSQGRLDGRLRCPDPLLLAGPVITDVRRALLAELDRGMAIVRQRLVDDLQELRALSAALDADIVELTSDLERAETSLATLASRGPDSAARPGDENQSESVVRTRRRREHCSEVAAAQGKVDSLRAELGDRRRRRADAAWRASQRRDAATALMEEMQALTSLQQSIYDQELLRHHPDRELLISLLVTDRTRSGDLDEVGT